MRILKNYTVDCLNQQFAFVFALFWLLLMFVFLFDNVIYMYYLSVL